MVSVLSLLVFVSAAGLGSREHEETLSKCFSAMPGITLGPSHVPHNLILLAGLPGGASIAIAQMRTPGPREVRSFVQECPATKEAVPRGPT